MQGAVGWNNQLTRRRMGSSFERGNLMTSAVIIDAVRTPVAKGKPGGAYSEIHPVDLHSLALAALVERTGIDPAVVDDVISGAVGQIGEQAGNTARWAALAAG